MAAAPVAICSVLVAELPPIVTTGLVPKIGDAPAGSPTALSVVLHGELLPEDVTVRMPNEAVAPCNTVTSVGAATEIASGFALKAGRAPAQGTRAKASISATVSHPRFRRLTVRGMAGTREFTFIDGFPSADALTIGASDPRRRRRRRIRPESGPQCDRSVRSPRNMTAVKAGSWRSWTCARRHRYCQWGTPSAQRT